MVLNHPGRGRLLAAAAVIAVWLAFVALSLAVARRDLQAGRQHVERARRGLSPAELASGDAERELRAGSANFRRGERRLRHPLLLPVRLVPVVGRQVRSAAALAAAAAQVSESGATAAAEVAAALADPPASGAERVAALEQLGAAVRRAEGEIRVVPLGPRDGLVRPLADARNQLADEIAQTRVALGKASAVTAGLSELLRGPRRYLLLATNNAEMRAGSGMILSAGVLSVAGGEFRLEEMQPTADLQLPGAGVTVEGDQAARWGWTNPGREWRNLGMTPRFDATAALAAQMWESRMGQPVDGVVALDVIALRAVLTATGPVAVGDLGVGADNVERHLFHDQYEGLAYDRTFQAVQSARRDEQGLIARAAVAVLQGGGLDLKRLGAEFAGAAAGRHALVWSKHPLEQSAWEAAGVSGQLASNSILPALLNRAGNKLDQYLEMEADLEAARGSDGGHDVTVTLRLTNMAPDGLPLYVGGPHPETGDIPAGTYLGLVALTVPAEARDLTFGPGVTTNVIGPDGPTQVVATEVRLARGEQRSVVAAFHLPRSQREVLIEPSARVPPVRWRAGEHRWIDDRRRIHRFVR